MNTQTRLSAVWLSAFVLALAAGTALADVTLPSLFSDPMVLQAKARALVWGWAKPREKVSVEIGGQKQATFADGQSQWCVRLKPMEGGRHPRHSRLRVCVCRTPPLLCRKRGRLGFPGQWPGAPRCEDQLRRGYCLVFSKRLPAEFDQRLGRRPLGAAVIARDSQGLSKPTVACG